MARIDVEKKQKPIWPWIAGLVVLALMGWGITELLAPPEEQAPPQAVQIEGANQPAAIPSPADEYGAMTDPTRPVEEVAPLGEEDVGQTIQIEGTVVATGNRAFWLVSGSQVVRVDSDRHVRKGSIARVEGTLRKADPDRSDSIAEAVISRHPNSGQWQVIRSLKLVEG